MSAGGPPFPDLQGWLGWLERLHPREIELGLARVRDVWARMGGARPGRRIITVAGTNGKGSCVAFLEAMLRAGGYSTAAYTSPHVHRYNERVRLGGEPVGDRALCGAFERVEAAREGTSLTYFEMGTLAALDLFARAGAEVTLLEVGLGGRLDAVNIVDADLALITNVSLEHTAWLGPDRESIGREKAGILRAGAAAVIGEADPPATVLARARELGIEPLLAGRDFDFRPTREGWEWRGPRSVRAGLPAPALRGRCQLANASASLMALELLGPQLPVDQAAVRKGLGSAWLPGRFQVVPGRVPVILDVAHNPAAARALADSLSAMPCTGRTLAVIGVLADKDLAGMLGPLLPLVDHWFGAPPQSPRALPVERLERGLHEAGASGVRVFDSVEGALAAARAESAPGDRILVSGSFITAAEAGALL